MKHLAVDIGSTRMKAALLDCDGQQICALPQYATPYLPGSDPLLCQGDAQRMYEIIVELLSALDAAAPGEPCALRLSTQMHGFVFANAAGIPLTPYISWQDNRCLRPSCDGQTVLERLQALLPPERMSRCGVYLKPGLALCNAFALLEAGDYAIPPGSFFCTLGSYLTLRLTGQNACHVSNAAATGFLDAAQGVWDAGLIDALGFSAFSFPDLCSANTPCGQLTHAGHPLSVYPDIGDQQAAVLGSLLRPSADVNLNLATAGQLSRISPRFSTGQYETRPYFEGQYLNTVTRLPAGRNLDVLLRFLQEVGKTLFGTEVAAAELYERLTPLIRAADQPLEVSLGFYPDMLDGGSGSITGIAGDNLTAGNLFRGAYGAMGASYRRHLRLLDGGTPPERLVLTGGVLQSNRLFCDLVTQAIGLPSVFAPCPDEVMLGHYRLCLIDSGICTTLEETGRLLCQADGGAAGLSLSPKLQFLPVKEVFSCPAR